jgi:3-oxoacyl-[acyl-carrier protein] reductase
MLNKDSLSLHNKVALVTGGGAGIGRAIVDAFGALGAKVAIAEIDPAKIERLRAELAEAGVDALVAQTDVRNTAQVAALMNSIEHRYGRLDVVVNNVGHHLQIIKTLEAMSEEEWDQLYQINLRHLFVVTKAATPLIRKGGRGGSIINVSSIEAFRANPYNALYTAFKHAVTGFTRTMALELAPDNIRVNAIAPETTDSEQVPLQHILNPDARGELLGQSAYLTRTLPSNRFGKPQDCAGAAVFLATDLSSWVNGSTVHVDGGGLAASGFQRIPSGEWTIIPEVTGTGTVV